MSNRQSKSARCWFPSQIFSTVLKFVFTMSSTGPAAKLTRKQFDCNCLKVLLETYAQKRIFDASFEGNKGENGSNKTISELFQERIEPAMLEWYHFYFQDCLNTSQQISGTLGSLKTVTIWILRTQTCNLELPKLSRFIQPTRNWPRRNRGRQRASPARMDHASCFQVR